MWQPNDEDDDDILMEMGYGQKTRAILHKFKTFLKQMRSVEKSNILAMLRPNHHKTDESSRRKEEKEKNSISS